MIQPTDPNYQPVLYRGGGGNIENCLHGFFCLPLAIIIALGFVFLVLKARQII